VFISNSSRDSICSIFLLNIYSKLNKKRLFCLVFIRANVHIFLLRKIHTKLFAVFDFDGFEIRRESEKCHQLLPAYIYVFLQVRSILVIITHFYIYYFSSCSICSFTQNSNKKILNFMRFFDFFLFSLYKVVTSAIFRLVKCKLKSR
jgi:hypothetical protein